MVKQGVVPEGGGVGGWGRVCVRVRGEGEGEDEGVLWRALSRGCSVAYAARMYIHAFVPSLTLHTSI